MENNKYVYVALFLFFVSIYALFYIILINPQINSIILVVFNLKNYFII